MNICKKIIVFCLCLAVGFSLVGCNLASAKALDVMDAGDFEDVMDDLDYTISSSGGGVISTKSLTVMDTGDFEDVLEDMDYYVTVEDDADYLPAGQVEAAYAYDEDYNYYALFAEFADEEDTVDEFLDLIDDLMETEADEDFVGSYKMTTGKNYQKCVIDGEFEDSTSNFPEGSIYMLVFQIENTLVVAMSYDNGESDIKEIDKIVEELGYFDASEDDAEYLLEGLEESSYAYDDDNDYYVIFSEYSDEEDAANVFDNVTDDLKDAKDDDNFDGTNKETQGKNYQKCVINGDFSDSVSIFSEGNTYMVVFQVEETLIVVMAYDNGKSDIKEVDSIVKELGY